MLFIITFGVRAVFDLFFASLLFSDFEKKNRPKHCPWYAFCVFEIEHSLNRPDSECAPKQKCYIIIVASCSVRRFLYSFGDFKYFVHCVHPDGESRWSPSHSFCPTPFRTIARLQSIQRSPYCIVDSDQF